jgi:hypothetical protein
MTNADALGADSSCSALAIPRTWRAYSTRACWNPPQVPIKGRPCWRAKRMARSAPSMLW